MPTSAPVTAPDPSGSDQPELLLVLDTNVCLDLFVFHDPRWQSLQQALINRTLRAITSTACRSEWLAVLNYPQLPVTDSNRPSIIDAFDQLITIVDPASTRSIPLPTCNDRDDQKFMELARDGYATHLITKDKQLLKCARKTQQMHLFIITTPELFLKNNKF